MLLFVIREGIKNAAESIAVMLHQSRAVCYGQICSHSPRSHGRSGEDRQHCCEKVWEGCRAGNEFRDDLQNWLVVCRVRKKW